MKTLSEVSKSQKITIMIGVMLAMLLSALDQTIVGTAMPRIVKELNGLQHLSWVFTAYMLASTVTIPIYGKLSDIYGRKLFFIGGILVFLLGSIFSGFSQSMMQLILFRGLQGIGGGAMMANAFTIIADLFPPKERGKWQGLMGGIFGLSSVIGPTLGGWLTDNASWRWNFYINIPIGIVALLVIWLLMPKVVSHIQGKRTIDYLGAMMLVLGLVPLLLGLVWGGSEFAWASWQIIGLFIFSLISIISFIIIEQKAIEPILPMDLFKNQIFSVSIIITFLTSVGMFGAILYIPLFAQGVLGITATNSGMVLTPMMIGLIFSSIVSGQIISKTGKYKLLAILGTVIVTFAMFFLSLMNTGTTQNGLIIHMVILGLGLGITMPIFNIAVQNAFSHEKLGVVTASTQLFRSIGGTVGVAVMGSVLNSALASKMTELAKDPFVISLSKINPSFGVGNLNANAIQGFLSPAAQAKIQSQLQNLPLSAQTQAIQGLSDFLLKIKDILSSSITEIFFIGAIFTAISILFSLFLKEIPLRKSHRPALEEAGVEIAIEEGDFPANSEPEIKSN